MGIDLCCNNKSFFTSYSNWHDIRIIIIQATIEYIQYKFNNITSENNNLTHEQNYDYDYDYEDDEDNLTYIYYMNTIMSIINEINTMVITKETTLGLKIDNTISIITTLSRNLNVMNAFNYFEINGLLALCNQNDCDGYYTPGNSLDICNLLDKIKDFIFNNIIVYNQIYINNNKLYSVFEESHKTIRNVVIN